MQVPVAGKRCMTPRGVHRNAKNFGFVFLKFRKNLVIQSHLVPTHGAPVGRIESQHHRLAA
jgi:hypothetical protein